MTLLLRALPSFKSNPFRNAMKADQAPAASVALARVTLAGFGEVAQHYARALQARDVTVRVFHPCASERSLQAAAAAGLRIESEAQAFADAQIVLSLTPGGASLAVAQAAANVLPEGAVFADFTSASPQAIRAGASLFAPGAHADVAIMGALSLHGHRTPLLAAGDGAERLRGWLEPLGFAAQVLRGGHSGDATALKLLRSVFTKGMDAVTIECLLAAEAAGLRPQLLEQMGDMDRVPMRATIDMYVRTHAASAARRLEEMREVQAQLEALGMRPQVTPAIIARYVRTVGMLGDAATNPPVPEGTPVGDVVMPWLLAAERAAPDTSIDSQTRSEGTA